MSDNVKVIVEADSLYGEVRVVELPNGSYEVFVDGTKRHDHASAHDVMRALANYMHGGTHAHRKMMDHFINEPSSQNP